MRLGSALFQTEGFTSAGANQSLARACDLAIALDWPDEHIQACSGMATGLNAAGRFSEAIAMMERFGPAELARMKPMGRVRRLSCMGIARTRRGELAEAESTFVEARRELDSGSPEDWQRMLAHHPAVALLTDLSQDLVCRGLFSSADACAREALDIAEQQRHISRVGALCQTGLLSEYRGDRSDAITRYTQALELAERYGLKAYGALAKCGLGRTLVATGQQGDGIRLLREGYSRWTTFGGRMSSSALAAGAATVLLHAGRRDEATEFLLAGEKTLQETEEKYQAAPLLALRGRLGELDGDAAAAETLYRQAIAIAEQQGALLYSLQAATALARLCQRIGRPDEANAVLRPIYERFTEGFDFPVLVRARAVLESRG